MYKNWHEAIYANFQLGKQSKRGWYSLQCPVCGDRKKRAGFIFTGDGFGYNCFRGKCGFRVRVNNESDIEAAAPSIAKLFRAVGMRDEDWDYLLYESNGSTPIIIPKEEKIIDPVEITLPFGATPLLNANPNSAVVGWSIDYLLNRGIDPSTETFYITTAQPPKDQLNFRNRLIIPFYYENKLIFYQGAWVHPTWYTKIKYLNTDLVERDTIFYNMDELNRVTDDPLFVVEGAFDAHWFQNSVGTLSNTLTEQQILRLKRCRRRKIIIPDNDKAGASLVQTAIDEGWDVSRPSSFAAHKDLDDVVRHSGKIKVAQEIMNSILETNLEKELLMELLKSIKKGKYER